MNYTSFSPLTAVHLIKGVPLDNKYTDTIRFSDKTAQLAFFMSYDHKTIDNLKPCHFDKTPNTLSLPVNPDEMCQYNYLIFKNENFSDRFYYAFITGVTGMNVNASIITFEIDVMQTWYFDYTLKESFVYREHVEDDGIGKNLVPENLETGEYICNSQEEFDFSSMYFGMLTSLTSQMQTASGTTINNVYSGLHFIGGMPVNDYASINGILKQYIDAGKEDSVIVLYQYPQFCGDATVTEPARDTRTLSANTNYLDGYTPKNNKLFTYPYQFIQASNNEGKTATYYYEQFTAPELITFDIVGVAQPTPCIFIYPKSYRKIGNDYDSGMTISNFPQCAWTGDAFKAWLAQNKGAITMSAITSVAAIAGGVGSENVGSVVGGISGLSETMFKMSDRHNAPPTLHGQVNTESLNAGMKRIKMIFYKMSIKAQFAKIIDEQFTRRGYTVNEVKVPNIYSRKAFNYIELRDAKLVGNIPFSDIAKIKDIYEKGITFWANGDVGNYSQDNSILTGGA